MRKIRNVSKKVAIFSLCGIMVLGLTACGAKASDQAYNTLVPSAEAPNTEYSMAWGNGMSYYSEADLDYNEKAEYGMSDSMLVESKVTSAGSRSEESLISTSARKVIKTASLNLQTLKFEEFQTALNQKVAESGAYLQYADVSGTDYYGGRKSANYTIRVPEANLDLFLNGVEGIATVVSKTLGEEDVTLNYVDTEARIKTLEIEQERLLALLEKADDLDSIIMLEKRLSEVRYNIECYQSKLRTYDDKITYSTVHIYVYEVTRVTEKEPETLWERISNGWADTVYDISMGAQDFLVWAVVNLPYLVFWGVVIVIFVVVLKKKHSKRKAKKSEKQSENNEKQLDSQE